MAWDSSKPVNNSKLVSSEVRANWTAIENSVLYDGSVAGPISGTFDITNLPSNLKFTRNAGGASYELTAAVTVENDGTSQFSCALRGQAEGSGGTHHTAIYGEASGGTSLNVGVLGETNGASTFNVGIYGTATGSSKNYGVYGITTAVTANDVGVYGLGGGGSSYAGLFYNTGTESLYGLNKSTSGVGRAIYGVADGVGGTTHYGVYGQASGATNNYGIYGSVSTNNSAYKGIYGKGSGAGHNSYAGYFEYGKTHVAAQSADKFIVGTEFWIDKAGVIQDYYDTSWTIMNTYTPPGGSSSYGAIIWNLPIGSTTSTVYGLRNYVSGGSTAYGIYSYADVASFAGSISYGVYGLAEGGLLYNYGIYGEVQTDSTSFIAIRGVGAGSNHSSYAGYFSGGRVYSSGELIADNDVWHSDTDIEPSSTIVGVKSDAFGSASYAHYGVWGRAYDGKENYGVYGTVANNFNDAYAIYGKGYGTTSYSGYFTNGRVKIDCDRSYWDFDDSISVDIVNEGVNASGSYKSCALRAETIGTAAGSDYYHMGIWATAYGGTTYNHGVTGIAYANAGAKDASAEFIGLKGQAWGGSNNYGVHGSGTGNTGNTYGVYGTTTGTDSTSYGVYGVGAGGNSYAGYFTNTGALSLYSSSTDTTGITFAIYGIADGVGGTTHYGSYGQASGATNNYGLYGAVVGTDATDYAVYGQGGGGSSYSGYFDQGLFHVDDNVKVKGQMVINPSGAVNPSTTYGLRVFQDNAIATSYGVSAQVSNATTAAFAIHGITNSSGAVNYGVYGISGLATTNYGVYGGVTGIDTTDYAIKGYGGGGDSYAGHFTNGRVHIEYDYSKDTLNREECAAINVINQGTGASGTDDSSTGIHLFVDGAGGDRHYGVYSEVNGGAKSNTGILGEANSLGATENNCGVYGLGEGGASNYGVFGRVDTNTAASYAIYGQGYGTTSYSGRFTNGKVYVDCDTTDPSYSAPSFYIANNAASVNVKLAGYGNSAGTGGTNIGMMGHAQNGSANYGVFARVTGTSGNDHALRAIGGGSSSYALMTTAGRIYMHSDYSSGSGIPNGPTAMILNGNSSAGVYATGLVVQTDQGSSVASSHTGIYAYAHGAAATNIAIYGEVNTNNNGSRAIHGDSNSNDSAYAGYFDGTLYGTRFAMPSETSAPSNPSSTFGAMTYYDPTHFADRGRLYIYNRTHSRWDYIDADGHL